MQQTAVASATQKVTLPKTLALLVLLIFYPITLQVGGNDAITTGSILIVFMVAAYLLGVLSGTKRYSYLIRVTAVLCIVATFSTLSVDIGSEHFGASFRRYVQFVTAIAIMWIIANSFLSYYPDKTLQLCEQLIKLIIVIHCSHIVIALIVYVKPEVGGYFSLFMTREREIYEIPVVNHITRLATIIMRPEAAGEMAVLCGPAALYFWLKDRSTFSIVLLGLVTLSVMLTVTRSTILLYALAQLMYIAVTWQRIARRQRNALIVALAALPILLAMTSGLWLELLIARIELAQTKLVEDDSILSAINRSNVWYAAIAAVFDNISLTGNGMMTIVNQNTFNFHSLYFTSIHQMGIIGGITFIGFLLYINLKAFMAWVYMRRFRMPERGLQAALMISLSLLLVNQVKYEFIRHSSYQQLVMMMFAVSYVLSFAPNRRIALMKRKRQESDT